MVRRLRREVLPARAACALQIASGGTAVTRTRAHWRARRFFRTMSRGQNLALAGLWRKTWHEEWVRHGNDRQAGHIDNGKTALVRERHSVDTERAEESGAA